jgi:molybdopterin/thiamine biosynthesis adenylyltransferase
LGCESNVLDLIREHDFIIDGTDNIEIRLLANDAALKLGGIPFFMGACVGSYGLTFPIGIKEGQPCLHCLLETISPIVVTTAARQVVANKRRIRIHHGFFSLS